MAYERTKRAEQQHARTRVALKNIEIQKGIIEKSVGKAGEADANYVGQPLKAREARALENTPPSEDPPKIERPTEPSVDTTNSNYDAMMDQVFGDMDGKEDDQ